MLLAEHWLVGSCVVAERQLMSNCVMAVCTLLVLHISFRVPPLSYQTAFISTHSFVLLPVLSLISPGASTRPHGAELLPGYTTTGIHNLWDAICCGWLCCIQPKATAVRGKEREEKEAQHSTVSHSESS